MVAFAPRSNASRAIMRNGGLAILPSPFRTMCGERGTFGTQGGTLFHRRTLSKEMRMLDYEKLEAAEEHCLEE